MQNIQGSEPLFHTSRTVDNYLSSPLMILLEINLVLALKISHQTLYSLTYESICQIPTNPPQHSSTLQNKSPTRKASNRLRDQPKTLLWQPTAYYYRITKCITDFMHLSVCFSYCYSAYLFTNLLAFRIKCWRASVTIALLRCECASALLVLHVL